MEWSPITPVEELHMVQPRRSSLRGPKCGRRADERLVVTLLSTFLFSVATLLRVSFAWRTALVSYTSSSPSRSQLSSGSTRWAHSVGSQSSDAVDRAVDQDLRIEAGKRPQVPRKRHPSLSIDLHLGRVRGPKPRPVAIDPTGPCHLLHRLHLTFELARRPEGETTLRVLRQIPAVLEVHAELRRKDHPSLRIERVLVFPDETCHQLNLPPRSLASVLECPFTPLRATLRPFPPRDNTFDLTTTEDPATLRGGRRNRHFTGRRRPVRRARGRRTVRRETADDRQNGRRPT